MSEKSNSEESDRVIPRVLWSNKGNYRYTGPVAKGFVASDVGYIDQALRISRDPQSFLDIDLEKAGNILKASRNPILCVHGEKCTQVLEARRHEIGAV